MKNIIFLLLILLGTRVAQSAELNDIKMADKLTVEGKALILNGMGLRKVSKFGIPVKVYVAGLYLEKKNSDSDALVKNDETKRLVMHFVRAVDRDALIEAFRGGYEASCFLSCDKISSQFHLLSPNVVSVRNDNEIVFTFYNDKVEIDSNGPNAKKEMMNNAELSRNLLSLFINKAHNPGEDFRSGLLGLTKNK